MRLTPNSLRNLVLFVTTLHKLGWKNVVYVAWYKFSLKSGLTKRKFPIVEFRVTEPFFSPIKSPFSPNEGAVHLLRSAEDLLLGQFRFYGFHRVVLGNPPNWFLNPFNGKTFPNHQAHWTDLPDFNPAVGDIKHIWESGRFEWVAMLSAAYGFSYDDKYLIALNSWLKDWVEKNPLNQGPHWKCGQEAGIRLIQLLNATYFLGQHKRPSAAILDFVEKSLLRIERNIGYALAQDNNHGTSEAAGLYIGGLYLAKNGNTSGIKFHEKGRQILEERIQRLVLVDGSFSQHSVTYHRLFLDTMSFVEFWRLTFQDQPLSVAFYTKVKSAIHWLFVLSDPISGDAPNLGANDGAYFLCLTSCDYRDFRPSLQLAGALFKQEKVFSPGPWDFALSLFGIDIKSLGQYHASQADNLLDGIYGIMKDTRSWALFRLPKFRFRPSHNDVHHFDLWVNGKNVLCDAGSYSYNPMPPFKDLDLKSTKFHNTICFDGQDQMPKISRFLLGGWLKGNVHHHFDRSRDYGEVTSTYRDSFGHYHERTIIKEADNCWKVVDEVLGNFHEAILGYNFSEAVTVCGDTVSTNSITILFPVKDIVVTQVPISKYYQQVENMQRAEALLTKPGRYETIIHLN